METTMILNDFNDDTVNVIKQTIKSTIISDLSAHNIIVEPNHIDVSISRIHSSSTRRMLSQAEITIVVTIETKHLSGSSTDIQNYTINNKNVEDVVSNIDGIESVRTISSEPSNTVSASSGVRPHQIAFYIVIPLVILGLVLLSYWYWYYEYKNNNRRARIGTFQVRG
jgi:hypothetical protein